jgi:hypothetical protein
MKRNSVLGIVHIVGTLSSAVAAQDLLLPRIIAVDKMNDNLYVLRGGGGHTVGFCSVLRCRGCAR